MSITEQKLIIPRSYLASNSWRDPRKRLDAHRRIAIDYDGTLIGGDGNLVPKVSKAIHEYVVKNHQEKDFWIITFRNEFEASACFWRLDRFGVTQEMFKGIRWSRPGLVREMDEINLLREGGYTGPAHPVEIEFMEFKAKACKDLGLTALVDDLPECVEDGCKTHGIEFIHAWDFARL